MKVIGAILLFSVGAFANDAAITSPAWRQAFVDEWQSKIPGFFARSELEEDIAAHREFAHDWERRYREWLGRHFTGQLEVIPPPDLPRLQAFRVLRRFQTWVRTTRDASEWRAEVSRTLCEFVSVPGTNEVHQREFLAAMIDAWTDRSGPWGRALARLEQSAGAGFSYRDFDMILSAVSPFAPPPVRAKPAQTVAPLVRQVIDSTVDAGRRAETSAVVSDRLRAFRDFYFGDKIAAVLHTWELR